MPDGRKKSELERFDEAFKLVIESGQFPTPTLLYKEMAKTSTRPNAGKRKKGGMMLSSKCAHRRIELLKQHGFIKDERTHRWVPGPRYSLLRHQGPPQPSALDALL